MNQLPNSAGLWFVGSLLNFLPYFNGRKNLFQAVPSAVYVTLRIIGSLDKTPRTVFIENVTRKKAKRSAIIVQEEIQSKTVSQRES